ncbi:MAG: DUF1361 domain-containing protein [Chloroflexi bacterium]|nr:DUF1361 domain-containing protein [Chloroflexota bacterium]MCI0643271.1 DUF1361 domain-containing protein [Chloroflexota bacterium]MCI0728164.1 DUF1361 domain-containing protein [Chloroflexota bacterium]
MKPHPRSFLFFFSLLLASATSAGMVVARFVYTGQLVYQFLVWNLFLAWLPLLFALAARRWRRRPAPLVTCALAWLLFLPNAPYLLTDLMHLGRAGGIPLVYDTVMLLSFTMTGLLLGFVSLYLMQELVSGLAGRWAGWLFAGAALGLSSFGVYLGRFLRWNSWDVFTNPAGVLGDVWTVLANPLSNWQIFALTGLITAVLAFTYVTFFSLPQVALESRLE